MNLGIMPNFTTNYAYKKSQNQPQSKSQIAFGRPELTVLPSVDMSRISQSVLDRNAALNPLRKKFQFESVNNLMSKVAEKLGFPSGKLSVRENTNIQGVFISNDQFLPTDIDKIRNVAKDEIMTIRPSNADSIEEAIDSAYEKTLLVETGNCYHIVRDDKYDGKFLNGVFDSFPTCFDDDAISKTKISSPFYYDARVRDAEREYENMRTVAHKSLFNDSQWQKITEQCRNAPDDSILITHNNKTYQVALTQDANTTHCKTLGLEINRIK